jgi:hypothetical protein
MISDKTYNLKLLEDIMSAGLSFQKACELLITLAKVNARLQERLRKILPTDE